MKRVFAILATTAACTGQEVAPSDAEPVPRIETKTLAQVGLSSEAIDRSEDPCQDFYQFACGGWMERTEIPADESRWVRSFSEIRDRNEAFLKEVLERADPASDDPVTAKLGQFFSSCMAEEAIEDAGLQPLEPILSAVSKVRSRRDLIAAVAELHRHGVWALWDLSAYQDYKDATSNIGFLDQNGLGLPDRDYYFDEDKAELRSQYVEHVAKMLQLSGIRAKRAEAHAEDIMKIETKLAEASLTRVKRRDPNNVYHKIDRSGVEEQFSRIDWDLYFEALGTPDLQDINVTHLAFFERVDAMIGERSPRSWRPYLRWQVLRSTASTLPAAFDEEAFRFSALLSGAEEQKPRWKRCIMATDGAIGELLAQPFIAERFAGDSKVAAQTYVEAIRSAFGRGLEELAWMDDATRAEAERKLQAVAFLIGYPPKWKDYDFAVDGLYATNALAARSWAVLENLSRIGQPVDRDRWFMTPPTVNAYYSPLRNQMVFPAGILQPPFYSVDAGVAVNLGAMGMVVGHELTHGFDDKGSKFDADGNLSGWWADEVRRDFDALTQCVVDQYASYEPIEGLNVNGELTLGENIADIGGLDLAFVAYRALREGKTPVVAEGFSEDQQFFLANAQVWCAKMRPAEAELRLKTDPHSPPRYRVNGAMANIPAFAEAFQCAPDTPMNPTNRCEVW